MANKTKLVVPFIIILVLIVSIALHFKGIFFTLQYYVTPLDAYNKNCTYDIVYGKTEVTKQIGLLTLDEENCLFIGQLNTDCFVVAELSIKNGRYAFKGTSMIYEIMGKDDTDIKNQTSILSGYISWSIIYNEKVLGSLSNVSSINEYELMDGHRIYLVIYDQ
jgi:hypothetical protein